MVICDDSSRILYIESGHYGANDPDVLRDVLFMSKIDTFSQGDEYVVADSTVSLYGRKQWCVHIKKRSDRQALSKSYYLSKAGVRTEHCFAAVTGRFSSLEELLRCALDPKESLKTHNDWIITCSTLHNFCLLDDFKVYLEELIKTFFKKHQEETDEVLRALR